MVHSLVVAMMVVVVAAAPARAAPTECPYEPPTDSFRNFDNDAIPARNHFGVLPDQASALGSNALVGSYGRAWRYADTTQRSSSYDGLLRVGIWRVHLAYAFERPDEVMTETSSRHGIGAGYRKVGVLYGGYVHYGYALRVNVGFGGDDTMQLGDLGVLRPFDYVASADGARWALTQETRFELAGCHSPFLHLMLQQRGDPLEVLSSFAIPVSATIGMFLTSRLSIGIELGYYFYTDDDGDEKHHRGRARPLIELQLGHVRIGGSFDVSFPGDMGLAVQAYGSVLL